MFAKITYFQRVMSASPMLKGWRHVVKMKKMNQARLCVSVPSKFTGSSRIRPSRTSGMMRLMDD